ncbi:hypothetical protein BC943DRAFT_383369 [Umbelopsis sp. AD052]|nr:hypothetical protein BC943DRAFT_383369 [Umbelopsis sp. AD052]
MMSIALQNTPIDESNSTAQRSELKSSASTIQSLNSIFRRMNMFPRQDSFKYPDSTSPHVDELMLQMCSGSSHSSTGEHTQTPELSDESSASLASSDDSTFAEQKHHQEPPKNARASLLINTKLRSLSRTAFRSPSNPFYRTSFFSPKEPTSSSDSDSSIVATPTSSNSIHYHSFAPINEIQNLSSERLMWIKSTPTQPVDIYVKQQNTRPESRLSFFSSTNWYNRHSLKLFNNQVGVLNPKAHEIYSAQHGFGGMRTSTTMPNMREPKSAKGVFYCRILRVSNKASTKDLNISVELEVNGVKRSTSSVTMMRSGKQSAVATFDDAFLFDVDGPFTCKIAVRAQASRSRITLPTLARRSSNRVSSIQTSSGSEMIFGLADLHYEKVEGMDKAIKTFSLGRYNDSPQDKIDGEIEVQLGVHLDVVGRIRESRSQGGLSGRVHSDYLTVYSRSNMIPKWTRYWAVVDNDDLCLYDFTYQEKKPALAVINLNHLRNISTTDEKVSLGCTGFSLEMDPRCVSKNSSVTLEEGEALEYRMLMIADSSSQASGWRDVFFEYISVIRNMGVTERQLVSDEEDGIDLRFLW